MSEAANGREELDGQPLGDLLGQLAARMAAPGAAATAAVEAALSASLVAMVGRFTKDEEHAELVGGILAAAAAAAAADAQRDACLETAADDQTAFSAVAEAMKLPRDTAGQQEERRRRLSAAQLDATRRPLAVLRSAGELVTLAGRVLPVANETW